MVSKISKTIFRNPGPPIPLITEYFLKESFSLLPLFLKLFVTLDFHLQINIQMIYPKRYLKYILIWCSISILQWGICSFCSLNISEVEFLLYLIWFDQWWDWFFCETCRQYFFWSFDIISLELLEWPAPQFQYKGNRFWPSNPKSSNHKGFLHLFIFQL